MARATAGSNGAPRTLVKRKMRPPTTPTSQARRPRHPARCGRPSPLRPGAASVPGRRIARSPRPPGRSKRARIPLRWRVRKTNPRSPRQEDERHGQEKLYAAANLVGGGFRPERAEGQLLQASGEGFHRSFNTGRSLLRQHFRTTGPHRTTGGALCHPTFCLGDATTSFTA